MTHLLANYKDEQNLFRSLLQESCHQRILMFRGVTGSGKTALLQACQEEIPAQVRCIPIQLRYSAVSVAEIFDRVGDAVGWGQFSHFTDQVAALQGVPVVQVERNWQTGSNNQINVALHAESQLDREQRRVALTKAWFTDLQTLPHLTMFMLDTYEQATTEVAQWVEGPFLARAVRVPQLRVLLAGQQVPDAHNIEWGHCCQVRDLFGVKEAAHWLELVEQMNRRIDVPDPFSWMAGICHALQGRPKDIKQIIENLPSKGPMA